MTDAERIELETLKFLVIYLLARDHAVHRQPMTPLWQDWLEPRVQAAARNIGTPGALTLAEDMRRTALWMLEQSESAAEKMGAGTPPTQPLG